MARPPRKDVADDDTSDDIDRLQIKELWLREEIRSTRSLMQRQAQWSITVLAAIDLNLYYIRRAAHAYLVAQKQITENELLPFSRWVVGTVFLCVLASLFFSIQRRFVKHHQFYRAQLSALGGGYSGIVEPFGPGGTMWDTFVPFVTMFTLPLFDLVLWAIFYVGQTVLNVRISIPW